jgi:hypothetical protein
MALWPLLNDEQTSETEAKYLFAFSFSANRPIYCFRVVSIFWSEFILLY